MHYKKDLAEKIKKKVISLPLLIYHAFSNFCMKLKRYFIEQHLYRTISGVIIAGGFILLVLYFKGLVSIFTGNAKSAINLFSALSASLAAIFAIFFTIPLIALQLVASKYTTKAYDFFFNRLTKIYMLVFICSIIFSFLTLGNIREGMMMVVVFNFREFNPAVSVITLSNIGIILCGMLLLLLIPYFFKTLEKLKPENLIKEVEDRGIKMNNKFGKARTKEEWYSEFTRKIIDVLNDITIGAVVNKDVSTFRRSIRGWLNLYLSVDILQTKFKPQFYNSFVVVIENSADESETISMKSIPEIYLFIREGLFKSKGLDLKEKIDSKRVKKVVGMFKDVLLDYRNPKFAEKAFDHLCGLSDEIIIAIKEPAISKQADSIEAAKENLKEIIDVLETIIAMHGKIISDFVIEKIDRMINDLLSSSVEIDDEVIEKAVNLFNPSYFDEERINKVMEKLLNVLNDILFPKECTSCNFIIFQTDKKIRIANHIIQKIPDLSKYKISEENLATLVTIGTKLGENMSKVKEEIKDKIRNELRGERDLLDRA